jgi:hypothetical protein
MTFGPGLQQVYDKFGNDTSISWALTPAVLDPSEPCLIEDNCNWEKRTVCAFNTASSVADHVAFLVCMDEHKTGKAEPASAACAKKMGISETEISKCYSDGTGIRLLAAAARLYKPVMGTDVPHVRIEDKSGKYIFDFHDKNITDSNAAAVKRITEALCSLLPKTTPACVGALETALPM